MQTAGRKLLEIFNAAAVVNTAFTNTIVNFAARNNPQFTFVGE